MQNDFEFSKNIYQTVLIEIDDILKKLNSSPKGKHVKKANDSAREILGELQNDIKNKIAVLKRHAEWDTFTIAFYGETNAGKSTIIETLRIMIGEKSKVEAQQKFKALQNKHGITDERFEALRNLILQNEKSLNELEEELKKIICHHDEQEIAFKDKIGHLQILISEKKKTASFWQKLLHFFQNMPEEKERKKAKINLKIVEANRTNDIKQFKQQQSEIHQLIKSTEKEHKHLESKLKCLEKFADGGIIGNGRSERVS